MAGKRLAAKPAAKKPVGKLAKSAPPPAPLVPEGHVERDPRRYPRAGDRLQVKGGFLIAVRSAGGGRVGAVSAPDDDPWSHSLTLYKWRKHVAYSDVIVLAEPTTMKPPRKRASRS